MKGKGLGKSLGKASYVAKRHQGRSKNGKSIDAISKPALKRLARRAGVKRLNSDVYPWARTLLKEFIESVITPAILHTKSRKQNTVRPRDVLKALQGQGIKMYGDSYTLGSKQKRHVEHFDVK